MSLFGTDGIRAPFGEAPLDEATVTALGFHLGGKLIGKDRSDPPPRVVLGGDTRESTPTLVSWLAAGLTAAGHAPEQVMARLRPPVFQRSRESFRRQMALWPVERLGPALDILTEAELDCKTTGMPDQAICERALMRIAHAAAGSRRG